MGTFWAVLNPEPRGSPVSGEPGWPQTRIQAGSGDELLNRVCRFPGWTH